MPILRINEFPEGSGSLSNDDVFLFMDDPSGSGITKKINLNELKNLILKGFKDPNVSLMLNFNNNFNDSSIYNHELILTEREPTLDTSNKKWGDSSLKLINNEEETGSYITINHDLSLELSDSNYWTIEFYVYATDWSLVGATDSIISKGNESTVENCWSFENGNFFADTAGNGSITHIFPESQSITFSNETWHHVAISNDNTTMRLFLDGTLISTASGIVLSSTDLTPLYIGTSWNEPAIRLFDGNIDDVRITKGQALYTSAFTPPTKQLNPFIQ
jgi:hypothetical protein